MIISAYIKKQLWPNKSTQNPVFRINTSIDLRISDRWSNLISMKNKTNKPMKANTKNPTGTQEQKRSTTITIPHLMSTIGVTALRKNEGKEQRKRNITIIIPMKGKT